MRVIGCITGLLLSVLSWSAAASPITYNINFTLTSGSVLPTSGGFVYDSALSSPFSNFNIIWNGRTYDLTASANAPARSGSCGSGDTTFDLMMLNVGCVGVGATYRWNGVLNEALPYRNSFSISAIDASEVSAIGIQYSFPTPSSLPDIPAFVSAGGTYSIVVRDGGGSSGGSVPEPASLALFGLGLLAFSIRPACTARQASGRSYERLDPRRHLA